jgi:hypothetical protein
MGWQGKVGNPAEAGLMPPDESRIREEALHQIEVIRNAQKKKIARQEARKALKRQMGTLAARMQERGVVHGDIFPFIDENGRMRDVMLDLRPLPGMENFPRLVSVTRSESDEIEILVSPELIQQTMEGLRETYESDPMESTPSCETPSQTTKSVLSKNLELPFSK